MTTEAERNLRRASRGLIAAETRAATARANRDETVRAALNEGMPAALIATITGLTRMRIYQIRDSTR